MSEVQDASFAIKAAEEAAAAGDFPTAEQYLSRAVELEELSSGPMHAELASILNNLGVVYERLDRPDKAEACYRRAYAIAQASLPPGDPGIELSATNLREFCAARGIPFEPSTSAHSATNDTPASVDGAIADKPAAKVSPVWPPSSLRRVEEPVAAVPKKASVEPERPRDAVPVEAPEPAALMPPRTLAIAALVVVAAIVGVIFVATRSSPPTSAPAPRADAHRCGASAGSTSAGRPHARVGTSAAGNGAHSCAVVATRGRTTESGAGRAACRAAGVVSRLGSRADAGERTAVPVDPDSGRMALHAGERRGRAGIGGFLHAAESASRHGRRAPVVPRRSPAAEDDAPHPRESRRGLSHLQPRDRGRRRRWRVEGRASCDERHGPARRAFHCRPLTNLAARGETQHGLLGRLTPRGCRSA